MSDVAPFRLGGRRVLPIEGDPPEQGGEAVDWSLVLQVLDLPPEQARFFVLHRGLGISRREIGEWLGWTQKRVDAVRKQLERRQQETRDKLRELFDEDFRGGSSNRLSFARQVKGGRLWNLSAVPLTPAFGRVMNRERKNISARRPKSRSLEATK